MDDGGASLDSLLERALADSGASSPEDAIIVALHASLLSAGFVCVALGDEVMYGSKHLYSLNYNCCHYAHCRDLGMMIRGYRICQLQTILDCHLGGTEHKMCIHYNTSTFIRNTCAW